MHVPIEQCRGDRSNLPADNELVKGLTKETVSFVAQTNASQDADMPIFKLHRQQSGSR